jgi:hypothetical protein
MKNVLAGLCLCTVLVTSGCDTISREDAIALVSAAEAKVSQVEAVVEDLKLELSLLPEQSEEAFKVMVALEKAEDTLEDTQGFLVDSRELLADLDASGTEVGFGILETGLTLFGLGGAAGMVGVLRRTARKHRDTLKILEEGITSVDTDTIARLDPDMAQALMKDPHKG